ncbi:DUF5071 domain-containing protein [Paenibacillus sp. AN1007]|uniref:DUF5071 domain-containing protein n=2 Tax=unclassified Paenibacillus TaxID=185978 RepID=A0AAU8N6U3_9BACL
MDIRTLIPEHKNDFERVEMLKNYKVEELKPIIYDLLTWLQDMNWPIALEIQNILLNFKEDLIPHIRTILLTDDDEWKYWILTSLMRKLPNHIIVLLKPELERIRDHPTSDELQSDLIEEVEEILNRIL